MPDPIIFDLVARPEAERVAFVASLSQSEACAMLYDWHLWARPKQIPPAGSWLHWLLLAGRGFGKSRTGAETVRAKVDAGEWKRVAFVARTPADARDVMVEGDSGILAVYPPFHPNRPLYEPSKRRLSWPNGARAIVFSSAKPDQLRGPQHDSYWADELAAWMYVVETWDNLMMGFRVGDPQGVVTTTPRPLKVLREIMALKGTVVTRGTTYENRANLAPAFFDTILSKYEGTRLGRQELMAEVLEDLEGALWTWAMIESTRVRVLPTMKRIVVAVDPAVTKGPESDETGITVDGLGHDGHGYLLADLSGRYTPDEWARRAVNAYHEHGADRIVAEVNQGGDLVEAMLRTVDRTVPYRGVHATRGKVKRFEPIAGLYEQGRVHHLGAFPELEDQLTSWTPEEQDESPDRADAHVWGLTDLMIRGKVKPRAKATSVK